MDINNNEESKLVLPKWVQKYVVKEREKNLKIDELISNTNYIDWIKNYTIDNNSFTDDSLNNSEKISEFDKRKIQQLGLFYEGITRYASKNYIYPTIQNNGYFYKIKIDELGFKIGMLIGQGSVFFCVKVPVDNEKEFIDFYDVVIDKSPNNYDMIKYSLISISNMIKNAYEIGVPIEAIINTIDSTVKEINSKESNTRKR